jgi:signal transduction histidine kinase
MITARSQVRRGETSVFVFGIEKPNPRYRPATEPNISRPQLPESPPAADGGYYSQPEPSLPDPAKEAEINPEPMFERDTRPLLYRELKITVFPIIGFKSNHIGVGYLVRDVTDEREVEQIKENFISIVSHEVRTPMAVILGLTELLALPNVEKSEQEEWVKAINQEALRLRTVLNDMQSMSRIKDGAFELSLEDIELKELVDRVVKVTQLQYRSHHNVTVDLDIPQSIIYSDRGKVTQVLTNLIGNAIKYTPENGEIKINAGTRPNHPNEIYISVTDQGIGIPKSEQHKVFSRFFRSRNTREKGIGGTGLGLAITQHLVKLMGGNVWFESEENRGSTFYFSLPLPQHNNLMLEDSNPEDHSNIGAST